MSFTIPPSNKIAGQLDLTDDLNSIYYALAKIVGANVLDDSYAGGADPTGATDSTAALLAATADAVATGKPLVIPSGTYTKTDTLDWDTDGLKVVGAGRNAVTIVHTTANTPIVRAGKHGVQISGLKLAYETQRPSTETSSIAMALDGLIGSRVRDVTLSNAAIGLGADPSYGAAPLFSCNFDNLDINGYSISAIGIYSSVGAYCTGSSFNNIYTTNNGNSAAAPPIDLRYFSNNVFNQLNVEHVVLTTDAIRLRNTLSTTFNSVDVEDVTFNGDATGVFGDFSGEYMHLMISGLRTQFCTFAGSASNCMFHNPVQWGTQIDLRGYAQKSNTVTTPAMYLTSLGSTHGVVVIATGIDTSLFTALRGSGTSYDTVLVNRKSIGFVGPPSVPASGGYYTNAYMHHCMVYVTAGSAQTTVTIDGNTAAVIPANAVASFLVPSGSAISLTYPSGSPSWTWQEVP